LVSELYSLHTSYISVNSEYDDDGGGGGGSGGGGGGGDGGDDDDRRNKTSIHNSYCHTQQSKQNEKIQIKEKYIVLKIEICDSRRTQQS